MCMGGRGGGGGLCAFVCLHWVSLGGVVHVEEWSQDGSLDRVLDL